MSAELIFTTMWGALVAVSGWIARYLVKRISTVEREAQAKIAALEATIEDLEYRLNRCDKRGTRVAILYRELHYQTYKTYPDLDIDDGDQPRKKSRRPPKGNSAEEHL